MPDRRKEKSLLFGKWMEGRMYGTNVPDIEMKRSGIEIWSGYGNEYGTPFWW